MIKPTPEDGGKRVEWHGAGQIKPGVIVVPVRKGGSKLSLIAYDDGSEFWTNQRDLVWENPK